MSQYKQIGTLIREYYYTIAAQLIVLHICYHDIVTCLPPCFCPRAETELEMELETEL